MPSPFEVSMHARGPDMDLRQLIADLARTEDFAELSPLVPR